MPIQDWFSTAYLVATRPSGLSANQLQQRLGCSFKTAWRMLDRFRCAMQTEPRGKLACIVEAGEIDLAEVLRRRHGRGATAAAGKTLVLGALEVLHGGEDCEFGGRLHLATAERADVRRIEQFLHNHVEWTAIVRSVSWQGYYLNRFHVTADTPIIHKAFIQLKAWLNGTHHAVDPNYLPHYLSEFAFRFNRNETGMETVQTLLGLACNARPLS